MQKNSQKQPIRVIISLDVEEEGLFSGRYASTQCRVENVALLPKLSPLTQELGFPLTLLCAHSVLTNAKACTTLAHMRDKVGAEIGAHLHHWSTPPLCPSADTEVHQSPQRSDVMDRDLLRQRLRTLLRAGQEFQGAPLTSFRMGRWDLKSCVRPLLEEEGILVDSSVAPLRLFAQGPDHFLAPTDPYWPTASKADASTRLLEVPITQISWLPALARVWYGLGKALPAAKQATFIDKYKFFGAMSANPVWHSAAVMRVATRLHVARGGKVLSLFWHSSEMLAGASPNVPNQKAADALLQKIDNYLKWLRENFAVQGIHLSTLHSDPIAATFPTLSPKPALCGQEAGDW